MATVDLVSDRWKSSKQIILIKLIKKLMTETTAKAWRRTFRPFERFRDRNDENFLINFLSVFILLRKISSLGICFSRPTKQAKLDDFLIKTF